jgi:cell division protein FtsL
MNNKIKNPSLSKILLAIILLQTAIIVYLLFDIYKNKNKIEQLSGVVQEQSTEINDQSKELVDVSDELERVKNEREKLGLSNDSLDMQIAVIQKFAAKLKTSNKLNSKENKELKELIARLRKEIIKRDQEIVMLKAQNDSLSTNVTNLKSEKAKLGDSLETVSNKSKEVEGKLRYASILKAESVKVVVLKSNGKEIEDTEYKASKIDRVKVSLTLADNKAAKLDFKDFYIRMVTPEGVVFSDPNNGGGTFGTVEGTKLSFTGKVSVKFDNSGQKLSYATPSKLNYIKGKYKIEIYCEGYMIGESGFIVD